MSSDSDHTLITVNQTIVKEYHLTYPNFPLNHHVERNKHRSRRPTNYRRHSLSVQIKTINFSITYILVYLIISRQFSTFNSLG